jgi:hypothetical protein
VRGGAGLRLRCGGGFAVPAVEPGAGPPAGGIPAGLEGFLEGFGFEVSDLSEAGALAYAAFKRAAVVLLEGAARLAAELEALAGAVPESMAGPLAAALAGAAAVAAGVAAQQAALAAAGEGAAAQKRYQVATSAIIAAFYFQLMAEAAAEAWFDPLGAAELFLYAHVESRFLLDVLFSRMGRFALAAGRGIGQQVQLNAEEQLAAMRLEIQGNFELFGGKNSLAYAVLLGAAGAGLQPFMHGLSHLLDRGTQAGLEKLAALDAGGEDAAAVRNGAGAGKDGAGAGRAPTARARTPAGRGRRRARTPATRARTPGGAGKGAGGAGAGRREGAGGAGAGRGEGDRGAAGGAGDRAGGGGVPQRAAPAGGDRGGGRGGVRVRGGAVLRDHVRPRGGAGGPGPDRGGEKRRAGGGTGRGPAGGRPAPPGNRRPGSPGGTGGTGTTGRDHGDEDGGGWPAAPRAAGGRWRRAGPGRAPREAERGRRAASRR